MDEDIVCAYKKLYVNLDISWNKILYHHKQFGMKRPYGVLNIFSTLVTARSDRLKNI